MCVRSFVDTGLDPPISPANADQKDASGAALAFCVCFCCCLESQLSKQPGVSS